MKSRTKSFLFMTISCIFHFPITQAQEQTQKEKPFTFSSVSIKRGWQSQFGRIVHNNFLTHTPVKDYLILIDDGYHWTSDRFDLTQITSVTLGFHPYDKAKQAHNLKRELRIALYFIDQSLTTLGSIKGYRGMDTTVYRNIRYTESINYIGVAGSYIYKTDPEKTLSFFAGYGMGTGVSYSSFISRDSWEDLIIPNNNTTNGSTTISRNESYDDYPIKTSFYLQGNIPCGLSLRLAKNKAILKNFSITTEGSVGINYQKFVNGKGQIKGLLNLKGGIRYNLVQ